MPDDIRSYSSNEFSLQVLSKSKSGTQELKEREEMEVRAIIEKWKQMEYEVRQSMRWRTILDACLAAAEGTSTKVITYASSEHTYSAVSSTGSGQPRA